MLLTPLLEFAGRAKPAGSRDSRRERWLAACVRRPDPALVHRPGRPVRADQPVLARIRRPEPRDDAAHRRGVHRIAAIGQTIVIVGGGIDLSVPWTLNCAAVLLTALARGQDGPLWIIPLILLGGVIVGIDQRGRIAILRVPPIVMTLSMNIVLQGLLFIATSGFPPPPTPKVVVWLATGRIGPFPVILLLWAVLSVAVIFTERRTSFGRYLYAVGTSRTVADLLRSAGGPDHHHRLRRQRRVRGPRWHPP